ncbi:MAG: carboxypeptidase [Desulfobacterales bacterium]|nr:MAG: carboxypeptidase [Desulfobacterales bacterium]
MGRVAVEPYPERDRSLKLWRAICIALRMMLYTGILAAGIGLTVACVLVIQVSRDLPKLPTPLSRIIETPQSLIYGADGQMLAVLGVREAVPLDMVSPNFIKAIVAVEDHRFFEHHGINKLRIIKGLYITLFKPGQIQGASTITQQLAKNLFFSFEQTWQRKFKEMLVAFQIEASCTKEEVLEAYINQIHFGAGAQGIEKAARTFFSKSAGELDLAEAALLAGLPKSPTYYNPFRHYERALARRDVVLGRMVSSGFITPETAEQALKIQPRIHKKRIDARTGSYFLDVLIQELSERYGEDVVFHGGIKVYATLSPRLQAKAEKAVREGLNRLDKLMGIDVDDPDKPQAALVAVETVSGAVTAMVGGRNYYASEFNRAVSAKRQAGSGFKPFVYYTAFNTLGMHPATVMNDRPIVIPLAGAPQWRPQNFNKQYKGPVILKQALISSINTIAAQIVTRTGPSAVIDTAKACGIRSPLANVYSVALGTSGVTVFDMASAFASFATLGIRHDPFLFWRVEDARGRILYERIVKGRRVMDPGVSFQVVDMMTGVVDAGSGRSVRQLGFHRPAAGKTGTTNDYKDAWFTGFTPSLSTAVWVGFDHNKPLRDKRGRGITGGKGAAPIWTDFMIQAMEGEPERDFQPPENISFKTVDTATGCPPRPQITGGELEPIGVDPGGHQTVKLISVAVKPGQINCPEEKDDTDP